MKCFTKKKNRRACRVKKNHTPHSVNPADNVIPEMTRITARVKSKRFNYNNNRNTHSFTIKYHYNGNPTIRSNTFVDYPTKEAAMRDCQRFEALLLKEGKIRGFKPRVLRETKPVIQRDDEAPIAGTLKLQAQCYDSIVIMSLFYYIVNRHIS